MVYPYVFLYIGCVIFRSCGICRGIHRQICETGGRSVRYCCNRTFLRFPKCCVKYKSNNPLLLEGGSIINGAFEREGVIDELSLVTAPVVADKNSKPLFMDSGIMNFELAKAENIQGNLVLEYKVKRC